MRRRYRVEITSRAKGQAAEAFQWLAERSPTQAARWYNGLLRAIRSLERYPRRYPIAPENELFVEEVRQMLYGKRAGTYRILYEIHGDIVYVTHVRHGARRPLGSPDTTDEDDDQD
jgi:plasmid stabilization system protein ParE